MARQHAVVTRGSLGRRICAAVTVAGLTVSPVVASAAWAGPDQEAAVDELGTVQGLVRDQVGIRIPGAVVTVGGLSAVTGSDGAFSIAGVAPGSQTLTSQTVCRAGTSAEVIVVGDATTTQNITVGGFGSCQVDAPAWETTSTVLSLTGDDESETITIPFSYRPWGNFYYPTTTANVSTNGYVSFYGAVNSVPDNTQIPTGTPLNDAVYAFWDDLVADSSSSISTGLSGTAPNRRFAIEWDDVHLKGDTARRLRFQIVLYENSNERVRIQYQGIDTGTAEDGRSATVGVDTASAASTVSFNSGLLYDGLSVRPK